MLVRWAAAAVSRDASAEEGPVTHSCYRQIQRRPRGEDRGPGRGQLKSCQESSRRRPEGSNCCREGGFQLLSR